MYYDTDTQYANFPGNPFSQTTKQQLNGYIILNINKNYVT